MSFDPLCEMSAAPFSFAASIALARGAWGKPGWEASGPVPIPPKQKLENAPAVEVRSRGDARKRFRHRKAGQRESCWFDTGRRGQSLRPRWTWSSAAAASGSIDRIGVGKPPRAKPGAAYLSMQPAWGKRHGEDLPSVMRRHRPHRETGGAFHISQVVPNDLR